MIQYLAKRWQLAIGFVCLSFFILVTAAFYPGFFSADTVSQYRQAVGQLQLSDWHPPVFALVWRFFIKLFHLTGMMLLIQMALLWGGVMFLSLTLYERTRSKLASIIPVVFIGLSPFVLAIAGTLWKDVHLAVSLFFVASLNTYCFTLKRVSPRLRYTVLVISALLVVYAASVRHGVALMAVPMLMLVAYVNLETKKQRLIYVVVAFVLSVIAPLCISAVSGAKRMHVETAVMLDDVLQLKNTEEIERLKISEKSQEYVIEMKEECTKREVSNNTWHACGLEAARFYQLLENDAASFRNEWIKAVISHPWAYTKYRFSNFFKLVSPDLVYIWHGPGGAQLQEVPKPDNRGLDLIEEHYVLALRDYGFGFRPYFWIILSVVGAWWAWRKREIYNIYLPIVLIYASGLVFILQYLPTTIAFDYRYSYWLTISTLTATILLGAEWLVNRKRAKTSRRKKA